MKPTGRNDPCPCNSGKQYKKCCGSIETRAASIPSEPLPTSDAIRTALAHHQAGRLAQAAAVYRQILQIEPEQQDALHFLGVIAYQSGNTGIAVEYYRKALGVKPDYAEAHNSLGIVLNDQGKPDEAIVHYRQALKLKPDSAEIHNNLGNTFKDQGKLNEAVACFQQALTLKPDYAEAYNNFGSVLRELGRLDEAEVCYRQALGINPNYVDAHNNLGATLNKLGRLDEADASYRQALEIKPDFAMAHNNLGNNLMDSGRLDEAEASYRRALEIKPDYAEVYYNLGITLNALGRLNEAEAGYRRALEIKPDYAEAYCNLANTQSYLGRLTEAEVFYRRALLVKPNYAEAHCSLGATLQGLGRMDEAEESCRRALEIKPDFTEAHNNLGTILNELGRLDEAEACYRRALEIKPDFAKVHSNLIFLLDMADTVDIPELQKERDRWDKAHAAPVWRTPVHCHDRSPDRRLRVGYVSADFREHSASKGFGGMLTRYDRSQFEVFAYSNSKRKDDRFTELFKQNATVWRDIGGLADDAVAQMIREDRIDILVDLSGHSAGNRLPVFARKPAPIQITAWGYATGTGMRAMDVLFADPVVVPPPDRRYFSEEVRYLPSVLGAFFNEHFPDVNELPALSDGIVTFGSLNRLAKMTDKTYRAWAEVLLAAPRSRLILKTPELNDALARERVIKHFTKAGVAAERIMMQGKTSWGEHMQAYHRIDLGLDPFPQGGGVTTLEGLMMGVPVITLRWPTVSGRVSASYMTTMELTGWIAETQERYVELAIRKAADLQSLAALRQQLRGIFTASVLGDQAAYTQAVEQEYRQLWREWCAKN